MRIIFILFLFLLSPLFAADVLVSVAPTKYLVDRISGHTLTVENFVPSGSSPHSYEPSARQIISATHAKIWFRIGENFEARTTYILQKNVDIVNLSDGLDLLSSSCCHGHTLCFDPHIWLSIPLLKAQAHLISSMLSKHFPESKNLFSNNLTTLLEEFDHLDHEIRMLFTAALQKHILVSHAAFGYFCRDYGLTQLSIEVDGKEPAPKEMTDLLLKAKAEKITHVFLEPQHNVKGGLRLAQELNATVIWLDPYKENVIENLRTIAQAFNGSCSRS